MLVPGAEHHVPRTGTARPGCLDPWWREGLCTNDNRARWPMRTWAPETSDHRRLVPDGKRRPELVLSTAQPGEVVPVILGDQATWSPQSPRPYGNEARTCAGAHTAAEASASRHADELPGHCEREPRETRTTRERTRPPGGWGRVRSITTLRRVRSSGYRSNSNRTVRLTQHGDQSSTPEVLRRLNTWLAPTNRDSWRSSTTSRKDCSRRGDPPASTPRRSARAT